MFSVTMYYRENCPACDLARKYLDELITDIPHRLVLVDIATDPVLLAEYADQVPYIVAGPYRLRKDFGRDELRVALLSASERHQQLIETSDKPYLDRLKRSENFTRTDGFSYWLSKHYMLVFNLLLFIYVGLPFAAPVFMELGLTAPAKTIYTIYSPLCHQLTFRSFFLFGEQPYYPRELANVPVDIHFEDIAAQYDLDYIKARSFIGDPVYGYKVALCERDVAIYGMLLLFGVIFSLTGRKIKSLPWYLWLLFAIIPMGLDGVSQLPSLMGAVIPSWLPIRESTPFLRLLTGGLFGWFTGWYLYPYIEESMRGTRTLMAKKQAVVKQIKSVPDAEQEPRAV